METLSCLDTAPPCKPGCMAHPTFQTLAVLLPSLTTHLAQCSGHSWHPLASPWLSSRAAAQSRRVRLRAPARRPAAASSCSSSAAGASFAALPPACCCTAAAAGCGFWERLISQLPSRMVPAPAHHCKLVACGRQCRGQRTTWACGQRACTPCCRKAVQPMHTAGTAAAEQSTSC